MQIVKCGVCDGLGLVYLVRPTTGPDGLERCSNCNGEGFVIAGLFVSFQRSDELPPTKPAKR